MSGKFVQLGKYDVNQDYAEPFYLFVQQCNFSHSQHTKTNMAPLGDQSRVSLMPSLRKN